jgi:hypothetical protein
LFCLPSTIDFSAPLPEGWCASDDDCAGFTFEEHPSYDPRCTGTNAEADNQMVHVWFKRSGTAPRSGGGDGRRRSYEKHSAELTDTVLNRNLGPAIGIVLPVAAAGAVVEVEVWDPTTAFGNESLRPRDTRQWQLQLASRGLRGARGV